MKPMDNGRIQLSEVDYDPFAEPELSRAVPTTDAQREVWLADQLGHEASLAYNEAVVLSLSGAVDVDALRASLLMLADRHESMRATFSDDGQMMLIEPHGKLALQLVDHSVARDLDRANLLAQIESAAVLEPFDLRQGPLFRASLIKLGERDHALLLAAHHIVCDGWSFGVLCRELMSIYASKVTGAALDIPAHADSFGDFALADRAGPRRIKAEADALYWVSQYEGSIPVVDLPVDRARGNARSFASSREDVRIEPPLVDAIRRLGASQGVSLFASLFGLFSALVGRLGGDGEAVVGVPAAAQADAQQHALIGHCVQLLPVRMNTDERQTVQGLLAQAGERVLDAYEHQSCTFGHLLSKLNVGREAGRLPLVSVQFNLDAPIPDQDLSKAGLNVSLRTVPRAFENFELFINAVQHGGAVVLECQYNTQLFDAQTVRRWLHLYKVALQRAVDDPGRALQSLFVASDDDRIQIESWNATRATFPQQARIEALFSDQAARTPEAVAVRVADRALTYRQLDQRANGLAQALRDRGVVAGQRVGMACGRNEHMVVALLGILKAGAAYVPLDPSFPADRLVHMQRDAALKWVVADRGVDFKLEAGISIVAVEDVAVPLERGPDLATDSSAAAYVIYTSGSTGLPKGVEIPHRAVVNFLHAMAREPGLKQGDRLLAVTTISFDIAVLELFLPMIVGAEVILADRDTVMDGPALRRLLEKHEVNVMQATPSGWRLLIDAGWLGGSHFKALVGGEALPDDLANELCRRTAETWNMYGPTETTVWSTCWRVPVKREGMRIGRPIANTVVHVMDEGRHECPIGVPGEIYIGGDGVAIGYLNQSGLTTERFLSDLTQPGKKLYRTGDRGRWRNDGTLEHLGRLDHQVKVRGYRIELGEIEVALEQHATVKQAVAITREDEPGDVRLVAYAVMHEMATFNEGDLLAFLRATLPAYMVPSHLVRIDKVPVLPNGKTNRKALPRPERQVDARSDLVAPRSELEAKVVKAMEQVLNLPGLSVKDDFFALGGHSLLAAKLTARLNGELGLSFPLKAIFEAPTAERYAQAASQALNSPVEASVAVVNQKNQSEAPLTVMQERIRFMEEMYPGRVVYNTPSAHRLRGDLDVTAFEQALNSIIKHQPTLRTYFAQADDGRYVQRVLPSLSVQMRVEDLSHLSADVRETELMRRLQSVIDQPIDIASAPLFKIGMFRMAADEHVFLFMPHHIIWDGWSFDILYDEISALYTQAVKGVLADLAPLTTTYVDFACWQQVWMTSESSQRQIQYWKERFAKLSPLKALPTDHARRPGMTGSGAVEWVHIDKALTERLRQTSLDLGVTVNMLIMGVYAGMLSQALDSPTLTLGVPVRGRLNAEFESIMGFFNNLLPISLKVDGAESFPDWLLSIKRDMLDAMANQDVPFERLASEPEVARHASKVGLYQSLYSFQDARERQRNWGGLTHSSVLVMQKGATEDLGLWLMEVPGGLEGGFNYNADLFDAATARAFRDRLLDLLVRVVETPRQTLQGILAAHSFGSQPFLDWVQKHHHPGMSVSTLTEDASVQHAESQHAATKNMEAAMAAIWASLLGVDAAYISSKDNFFDLGGNSLLVMHAVAKVQAELGLRTDPRNYLNLTLGQLIVRSQDVQAEDRARHESTPTESGRSGGERQGGMLSRLFGRRKG